MEIEKEIKAKELSIQSVVDFIGNHIVENKIDIGEVGKAIGEVPINNTLYQIQIILEPNKQKWIKEIGIVSNNKKQESWIKRKISSLF